MTDCYACNCCGDVFDKQNGVMEERPKSQFIINDKLMSGGYHVITRDYCDDCSKKIIKIIRDLDDKEGES